MTDTDLHAVAVVGAILGGAASLVGQPAAAVILGAASMAAAAVYLVRYRRSSRGGNR